MIIQKTTTAVWTIFDGKKLITLKIQDGKLVRKEVVDSEQMQKSRAMLSVDR